MADNRTMALMLQAPIEGYEDAIVVPPINANNFELKQPLINLVQSNKFTGRQDPHNHLRFFNKKALRIRIHGNPIMNSSIHLSEDKSIAQGPFELGTTMDTLGTTPEGGILLGPERPRTYEDLSDTEKKRYDADVR
ncbi:hypothetical protein Tco_1260376, partial [Tanacetum coccineum]